MRFCIVTPTVGSNDGQGRVNAEIAAEARRQGHEVVLIAERIDQAGGYDRDAAVALPPPAWLPGRLLRDQLFAWRSRAALARRRGGLDAVLANGFVTWARSDVNAVHFIHASWLGSAQHPWRQRRSARSLYAWLYSRCNVALERIAFRGAGHLVAVSAAVAGDLGGAGIGDRPISVVLNGVDTDEFHPGPADRESLNLPSSVPIALFAGDLKSPRKNLETVLRALPAVPGLHLAVAGRQAGTPYPDLMRALGVADRVHFLGFRRDMPALMRACDLFVFPSRYEACSLVLLEALASGIPVVTARSAGGSELITPAVGLVLADPDDVEALAAGLRSLVSEEDRRRAMGQQARALAERHAWSVMARRYVDLLVDAAGKRGGLVHA